MNVLYAIPFVLMSAHTVSAAEPPKKTLPLEGEVFEVAGRTAFLIPGKADPHATAKPWVWYAPTLPNLPGPEERWMFEKFRAAGIAIAGIDAGESYGSPNGNKVFDALHAAMIAKGYSQKPVLLGRSRGGLMTLSWATANPDKVAAFAGIYPVCDIASYPGIERAAGAFNLKPDELKEKLKEFNPVDRLEGLAKAKVPLFAIHGDIDKVVPLEANSGRMKERYAALGGSMALIVPQQQGHNMWPGFFQCHELVQFVIAHAGVGLMLESPQDFQVVQRNAKNLGTIRIRGKLGEAARKADALEFRLGTEAKSGEWRKLDATLKEGQFEASVEAVAGGWYRLDVRGTVSGKPVAEVRVERVGVGEVFVVAGQSNSANHGAEKQATKTNRVAAFDRAHWQLANDPQPGASGNGGSFLPPFGDAIAEKFNVPVGIIACGVGATSVREWLPKGATFPNPPTIESRVKKLADGTWESKGELYESFRDRMKQLGPNGFRAVLWHQGESDANQKDATRTLPGKLYREYLEKLIRVSRKDIGWDAPWFVAQVSYHGPGDEASPDIREAQAGLWKDGLAIEGPDSDALKGESRDNGGKGVHFSGQGLRIHAAKWAEKVGPWLERQIVVKAVEPAPEKPKPLPTVRFPFDEEQAKKFQDDYLRASGLPREINNSLGMKLVLIPPGSFEMGPNGSKYRVSLSKPFCIGATEVTLGQYRKFKAGHRIDGADDEFNDDDRPAAMVSWEDARGFCVWLSEQEAEKKAGRVYSLPTEAQWEWAARAGTATTRYFGDTDKEQTKYSWFNSTYTPNPKSETKGRGRQPVGKLPANAWGLHDTLGNVWEWCGDRRSDSATGETRDPVMRGGSWRSGAFHCTAVAHDPAAPGTKGDNIGFRVVITMEPGK